MRTWIIECLDLKLDEGTLDLFCAKCQVKILMACILYLTKDDRSDVDGGMLKLFDTEKKENPDKLIQNLFPEGNSFPHWASGLVSRQGPRAQAKREPPPSLVAISPQELEEAEFYRWMNPSYLDPETQSDIQTQLEQSSEISLSG